VTIVLHGCYSFVGFRLSVGGTLYEVARSTIKSFSNFLFALRISDTKLKDSEQEVLDSNGPKSGYVLDDTRGQKVNLPFSIDPLKLAFTVQMSLRPQSIEKIIFARQLRS